jgi:ABC-2 type transport system permease protein
VVREWQLLLLVVLLPLAFLAMTAFGYSTPMQVTHPVLVSGASAFPDGSLFVQELAEQRYPDGRPVFDVGQTGDSEAARAALRERTVTALATLSGETNTLTISGDGTFMRFFRASLILESVTTRLADRLAGRPQVVRVVEKSLGTAGPVSEYDIYAPGMIIFALLLIVPQTAMLVARELRWNTLRRLRLTPMHALELLAGISLAQMVVAVFQVVIVFVGAVALGFNNHGSLGLAILVGLAVSFSAIGLGLVVACFVENDSQAINLGSVVAMIQVCFSGSFYRLPPMTVFTLAGYQIDLFDVFPATHGFSALRQVLSYGVRFEEVGFRLAAMLVLSMLYFGVGVVLFQRLRMRDSV